MFCDDFGFALLDSRPIQLARIDSVNAKFLGLLQVIPDFGIEQQRLGRNAAHVQTGPAQLVIFFNQAGPQTILPSADGSGVARRPASDYGYVIDGFRQSRAPC